MKLKFLAEARKNWDHPAQQKVYGADKLRQYANDDNIYISFTEIDKLGINPNSEYQTPLGIYTYPLKHVFDAMDEEDDIGNVPFAGRKPWVYVCKSKIKVLELSTYDNLDNDIAKIDQYLKTNDYWKEENGEFRTPAELINHAIRTARKVSNMDASRMWNITRFISESPTHWNAILRKVLGYDAISDKTGIGIIHPAEPIQAVFLSIKGIEVIDKIRNKDFSKNTLANDVIHYNEPKNQAAVNHAKKLFNKEIMDDAIDSISMPIGKLRNRIVDYNMAKHNGTENKVNPPLISSSYIDALYDAISTLITYNDSSKISQKLNTNIKELLKLINNSISIWGEADTFYGVNAKKTYYDAKTKYANSGMP